MADSGLIEGGFCLGFFLGKSLNVVVDEKVNGTASAFKLDTAGNLEITLAVITGKPGSSDGDDSALGGPGC